MSERSRQTAVQQTTAVALVVAGGTAMLAVAGSAVTYIAAAMRYDDAAGELARSRVAFNAFIDHDPRQRLSGFEPPTLYVHRPVAQLSPMLEHVAILTGIFAVSLTILALLAIRGRPWLAALGACALAASAAFAGGPLSLLVPVIPAPTPAAYLSAGNAPGGFTNSDAQGRRWLAYVEASPYFAAPLWWRICIGLAVLGLLSAVLVVVRRPAGPTVDAQRPDHLFATVGYAALCALALLLVSPPLVDGSGLVSASALLTSVALAATAFHAGTVLRGKHSLSAVVAVTGVAALVSYWLWASIHVDSGAPQVFGFDDMGDDPPPIGNGLSTALLVAALPAGYLLAQAQLSLSKVGVTPPYRRSRAA